MSPSKRFWKARPIQFALASLAALYLRVVLFTLRLTTVIPPATQRLVDEGRPFIFCFWHGRLMMMPAALPRRATAHVLISGHRDGVLISRAIQGFGLFTVAAARRKGGQSAMRAMVRLLADGQRVAITPDGPRGPRMRAKPGAVKTAQLAGVPLIPATGAASWRILLHTWDRFCLPLPFGRGVILMGEPIHVPTAAGIADQERLSRVLEDRLNALTAEADRRFGHRTVEPAAVDEPTKRSQGHARA
jgi:lysophospholipid acyltransferase (LPLAT)-like uncharacterized protein